MREILFRAKRYDENNDDWIYGYLHKIDTKGDGYIGYAIQQQNGDSRPYSVRVKDKSIGQYTGLKDKKGFDIYEGDIIECKMRFKNTSLPHMGVIVYDEDFGAFATFNLRGNTLLHNHLLNTVKIVGNKFKNPELL